LPFNQGERGQHWASKKGGNKKAGMQTKTRSNVGGGVGAQKTMLAATSIRVETGVRKGDDKCLGGKNRRRKDGTTQERETYGEKRRFKRKKNHNHTQQQVSLNRGFQSDGVSHEANREKEKWKTVRGKRARTGGHKSISSSKIKRVGALGG